MIINRSKGLALRGAALAAAVALSACQSNGLTPESSAFQSSSAPPSSRAQHSAPKAMGYVAAPLGTLGGTFGVADGINNRGWTTGESGLSSGVTHAALWEKGQTQPDDLGTLGGPNSAVQFPNKSNAGNISGDSDTTTKDPYDENFCGDGVPETCLAFDWRAGKMTALPTLGGNNGQADGNNSGGEIVGFAETDTKNPSCVAPQVFNFGAAVWSRQNPGDVSQLPNVSGDVVAAAIAVNDRGDVVGISGPTCGSPSLQVAAHAVLWKRGGNPTNLQTLGGAYNNAGLAINNRGDTVGVSDLAGDAAYHAVLWKKGKKEPEDLGTLPGDVSSEANGINMKGQIVGYSIDASGNSRAVLWENGAIYDLNTLIQPSSGLYLLYGADIDDEGVIVGDAMSTTGGNMPAFVAKPDGKKRAPTMRQKVALPQRALAQLLRSPFGRFHSPFAAKIEKRSQT